MRILQVHNRYQQPGGEDAVVENERELLRARGHDVLWYERSNWEIADQSWLQKARIGIQTVWAQQSARDLATLIRRERPHVAHFHNTFPLISPSAYYTCRRFAVPVVQTLHNYRLLCPKAVCYRDGIPCEICVGKRVPWPGVRYACYRDSRLQSSVVAALLAVHNLRGTWTRMVDTYIALSQFARTKFIEGGLPAASVVVKPNFLVADPGVKENRGAYALFVGRLTEDKGVRVLLAAWRTLPTIPLVVVGGGPLEAWVRSAVAQKGMQHARFVGSQDRGSVNRLMKGARFLVMPSMWYEGLPMTLVEAFACGVPVVASRLGALEELVEHGRTGLHFTAGDSADLAAMAGRMWSTEGTTVAYGRQARVAFEKQYTAQRNYQMLQEIYFTALRRVHA